MAMRDPDILAPLQSQQVLREKIGWICQGARYAAIVYALWVIFLQARYWSDLSAINAGYGRLLQRDLSEIGAWQQAGAFGVNLVIWLFVAYACYSAWRLFSFYLEGEIFSLAATKWLRRLATFGIAAQALAIFTRPLVSVILTLHFPPGQRQRILNIFIQPDDLAILLLLLVLLTLAHIQKSAAEIADDHAQFV
ncbi:DUF2975 domain-containing protein [Methylocystis heyeri]|nr:DUF2975 domain-containing protein [Methylocystis heyeri]